MMLPRIKGDESSTRIADNQNKVVHRSKSFSLLSLQAFSKSVSTQHLGRVQSSQHLLISQPLVRPLTNVASDNLKEKGKVLVCSRDDLLSSSCKVLISVLSLLLIPLPFYGLFPYHNGPILSYMKLCWDSLLHINSYAVAVVTLGLSMIISTRNYGAAATTCCKKTDENDLESSVENRVRKFSDFEDIYGNTNASVASPSSTTVLSISFAFWCTPRIAPMFIVLFFALTIVITSHLHIATPSFAWMPLAWGSYSPSYAADLTDALKGLCTQDLRSRRNIPPLCLSEHSWKLLSAGAISSQDAVDVSIVKKGVQYAKTSGGLVVNIMARDVRNEIEPLQQNVEALSKFFPNLAVVIFENDSMDGSREKFMDWRDSSKSYVVDLMECEDAPGCKFGEAHRYEDGFESIDYFKRSAVGSMVRFRQRMNDYILTAPAYQNYTHMLIMDMDLGISVSPLGLLHSLGKAPNNTVASSGRTMFPGSLGTLVVPYDFSAFRPYVTDRNERVVKGHSLFCELMPPGDKWRNQCDAVSSMQLMEVLVGDRLGHDLYRVSSAFNGAVLYPLRDVRESGTKYDWGEDGQRCEHIGFNVGLKREMYVNKKWDMHLNPSHPGGPSGQRAVKQIFRISTVPQLGIVIFLQNVGSMTIFVYSIMTLGMHVVFPSLLILRQSLVKV
jgi:hypothetical protein